MKMVKGFKKYLPFATMACFLVPAFAKSDVFDTMPKQLFSGDTNKVNLDPNMNVTDFLEVSKVEKEDKEILFSADEMESNSEDGSVIAKGNVTIVRQSVTVQADEIRYFQKEDRVTAIGNVTLLDESGNAIFADYINLEDEMDSISMENIKLTMVNESNMVAKSAKMYKSKNKLLEKAVYSPCDLCESEDPLWQIKARKIRHNAETKNVNYNDAFLEVKGVPVLYTPFFSHPDPTVKRRSGFLPPTLTNNNYFGARLISRYFLDIDEHQNMLISPQLSSKAGPILAVDYDKYFYNGELNVNASYLDNNKEKGYGSGDRGNLYVKSRYEINDNWVSDVDLKYVSDRTYLKDFSLKEKDDAWLNSSVRLQGFDDRNYSAIEALYYKRISYDLRKEDKPFIVPLITHQNISDVNEYGLYNKNDFGISSIYRRDDDSSYRASMINSWALPSTTSYGAKYKMVASVKTDLYYIDNYTNVENENFDGSVLRVFPQLAYEWRLPFVRATESSRQIIEPITVAVLSPNGGNKEKKIPNNDSRNPRLDDTNVLDISRYSGYDINDTGSRVSYGVNWSSYGDITGRSSLLLAQSYKFRRGDAFSKGEDEKNRGYFSDYIGRLYANPYKYLDFNYRFILDRKDYELEYSELSTKIGSDILSTTVGYIFLKDDNPDSISRSNYGERKELYVSLDMALTKNWSLSIYNRQDLTKSGGSLEHGGRLEYEDECLILAANVRKDNSNDPEYKGNFEVTLDLFLKTLGGIGSN